MKTLDIKAEEYTARICNQSGTYSKGEIETAYVTGAIEQQALTVGEEGSFGQALASLQAGFNVARTAWNGRMFVTKQIDSDIPSNVVPKMQSLPSKAKEKISSCGDGSISYRSQCLIVYPHTQGGVMATNFVTDWIDMFAADWIIVE